MTMDGPPSSSSSSALGKKKVIKDGKNEGTKIKKKKKATMTTTMTTSNKKNNGEVTINKNDSGYNSNGGDVLITTTTTTKQKKKTKKEITASVSSSSLTTKKKKMKKPSTSSDDDDDNNSYEKRKSSSSRSNDFSLDSTRSLSSGDDYFDDYGDGDQDDEFRQKQQQQQQHQQQQRMQYVPLRLDELPDADEMMGIVMKDVRTLKVECKRMFDEMEQSKRETDAMLEEVMAVRRKAQIEKLMGNELIKIDHLLRLGFDEDVIRDHLKEQNKTLQAEARARQQDVKNLEANISKMTSMNKECERAVTAAHGAFGPLVVRQQALQAKMDQVELELYSVETKVKHRRNMKSVEFLSKDRFKDAIKEIVKEVQNRCTDSKLTREVLKVAGQTLSADLGMNDGNKSGGSSDDSDDDSSSASSNGDDDGGGASSDVSSDIEVSSVESD